MGLLGALGVGVLSDGVLVFGEHLGKKKIGGLLLSGSLCSSGGGAPDDELTRELAKEDSSVAYRGLRWVE